jgi:hypothetical protein
MALISCATSIIHLTANLNRKWHNKDYRITSYPKKLNLRKKYDVENKSIVFAIK